MRLFAVIVQLSVSFLFEITITPNKRRFYLQGIRAATLMRSTL